MKILLAEDSLVNQKLAIGLLTKHGHSVCIAHNGREAVDMLHDEDFDVVLMDVQMPILDGLSATRVIRCREKAASAAHIPIIAMTAHAIKGDRERCLEAGMDGYVAKPMRTRELFEVLRATLNGDEQSAISTVRDRDSKREDSDVSSWSGNEVAGSTDVRTPADVTIDWQEALSNCQGSDELLAQIATIFVEESSKLLREMNEALASGDAELLQRAAHTIKSGLRNLGIKEAYGNAMNLEEIGRIGDFDETTPQLLRRLERQIDDVQTQLAGYIRGRSEQFA